MNELLGWYGYNSLNDNQTIEQQQLNHLSSNNNNKMATSELTASTTSTPTATTSTSATLMTRLSTNQITLSSYNQPDHAMKKRKTRENSLSLDDTTTTTTTDSSMSAIDDDMTISSSPLQFSKEPSTGVNHLDNQSSSSPISHPGLYFIK